MKRYNISFKKDADIIKFVEFSRSFNSQILYFILYHDVVAKEVETGGYALYTPNDTIVCDDDGEELYITPGEVHYFNIVEVGFNAEIIDASLFCAFMMDIRLKQHYDEIELWSIANDLYAKQVYVGIEGEKFIVHTQETKIVLSKGSSIAISNVVRSKS